MFGGRSINYISKTLLSLQTSAVLAAFLWQYRINWRTGILWVKCYVACLCVSPSGVAVCNVWRLLVPRNDGSVRWTQQSGFHSRRICITVPQCCVSWKTTHMITVVIKIMKIQVFRKIVTFFLLLTFTKIVVTFEPLDEFSCLDMQNEALEAFSRLRDSK